MSIHFYQKIFIQLSDEFIKLSKSDNINETDLSLLKQISSNLTIFSLNSISNIVLFKSDYIDPIKKNCLLLIQSKIELVNELCNKTIKLLENFEKELSKSKIQDLEQIIKKANEATTKFDDYLKQKK